LPVFLQSHSKVHVHPDRMISVVRLDCIRNAVPLLRRPGPHSQQQTAAASDHYVFSSLQHNLANRFGSAGVRDGQVVPESVGTARLARKYPKGILLVAVDRTATLGARRTIHGLSRSRGSSFTSQSPLSFRLQGLGPD